MCVLSKTFLIIRRIERDIIQKNYIGIHVNYPLFLPDFNETWIFSTDFWKILEYEILRKSIQSVPGCSMLTDRQNEANGLFAVLRMRLLSALDNNF